MSGLSDNVYMDDPGLLAIRIRELEAKVEDLYQSLQIVERTQYGVQQMLGKAAEYQGKPRGRLPR